MMDPQIASVCPDGYQAWHGGLRDPAEADLCLRYALAFKTLDFGWLNARLAPDVSYASQSVFDKLEGKAAVVQVRSLFPGATVTWINVDTASNFECWQLQQASFLGFPSVAAYWRDRFVYRHQGLLGVNAYVQAIRNATAFSPTRD